MKRLIFFLVSIFLFSNNLFCQVYLESDESQILFTEFTEGIPMNIDGLRFTNFINKDTKRINNEDLNRRNFVKTNAQESTIIIRKNNIGRIVLYATLYNEKNSSLFNYSTKSLGNIKIKVFKENLELESESFNTIFDQDLYQQIHINYQKTGIDKIQIVFETNNDLFIVEKLKIIPLSNVGVQYYSELERLKVDFLNSTNNEILNRIKTKYITQLSTIHRSINFLSVIIEGQKITELVKAQTDSLNPIKSEEFIKNYNEILKNANSLDKTKINDLISEIKKKKYTDVANTLNELFTGGKFSILINLIDGLFSKKVNIDNESIIKIDNKFYTRREARFSKNNTVLKPVSVDTEGKINSLVEKNKTFKKYVKLILEMMVEDVKILNQLNNLISNAKSLKIEMENLALSLIRDSTREERVDFINDSSIDFVRIMTKLDEIFNNEINMNVRNQIREESIINFHIFNELLNKYNKITSKIMSQYELIYEINPKKRKNAFDKLSELPNGIKFDWLKSQDKIIDLYTKNEGFKEYLKLATKY